MQAHHLGADHHHRLGHHRVDLARHDRAARLQRRQLDFPQAGQRPGVHPAQVVGNLHQCHRQHIELAGQLDRVVLAGQALEQVGGSHKPLAGDLGQLGHHRRGKTRIGIDPGPHRRAAQRQPAQAYQAIVKAAARTVQLGLPGAEFLAEGQRHRIHQVGAPGLDHLLQLLRPPADHRGQVFQRRQQPPGHRADRGHPQGGRDHIVGTLAQVDVVVGMHGPFDRQLAVGQRGNHLIGIHVGRSARTGLVDIHREMGVMPVGRHLGGSGLDRGRTFGRQQAKTAIDPCRRRLDQPQCGNETGRQRPAGDREIVQRTLGLGTPQGLGRHLQLPHRIMLGTPVVLVHVSHPCRATGK